LAIPSPGTTRTAGTRATLAATFRALEGELINPSFLHVIGASRPRATTSELSGLAITRWLRPLAALPLPFGGGDAVGKLPGLNGFQQGFDGVGLGLGVHVKVAPPPFN
jgi:hypothetical protein